MQVNQKKKQKPNMDVSKIQKLTKSKLVSSLVNSVLIGICALPILYFKLFGTPTVRGFFCDDQSISYPYHSSTVSSTVLYIIGLGLPILTIIIGEKIGEPNTRIWLTKALDITNCFLMGAVGSQLIVNIGKYTVGRLRPHFFAVCNVLNEIDCNSGAGLNKYIANYSCPGNKELFPDEGSLTKSLKEVHLSFPSGHANFSFQAAVFIMIYLQTKYIRGMNFRRHTFVSIYSLIVLSMATFTAVSRVMDNKHHPTDVLAGSLIGSLTQIVFSLKFLNTSGILRASISRHESIPLIETNEAKNS